MPSQTDAGDWPKARKEAGINSTASPNRPDIAQSYDMIKVLEGTMTFLKHYTAIAIAIFGSLSLCLTAAPSCDSGNGGITLPAGFCAEVVADGLGAARHLVVAPNGDVYVALQGE